MRNLSIKYIHHSSFLLETDDYILLFDYFKGDIGDISNNKKVYIFSSHSHGDHFSNKIFSLDKGDTTYILSDDIRISDDMKRKHNIIQMNAGETLKLDCFSICTYLSNDLGVAFLIKDISNKLSIYHAGDLNAWVWNGETEEYNNGMELSYKRELSKISKEMNYENINIAFIPLDGRLEDKYSLGIDYFMDIVGADYVFPMHLWGDFNLIRKFKEENPSYRNKIMDITKDNEIFQLG